MHPDPHILVVGGTDATVPLIWGAHPGVTTSVVGRLRDLAGEKYLSEHETVALVDDAAPIERWVDLAAAIHRGRPVSQVVAFEDNSMYEAAAIAAALGVPGHSRELVRRTYDKSALRATLREHGVEDVPSAIVDDPEDIVAFGDRHGWPVFVKPSHGTGSNGVTKVGGPEGAAAAYAHARMPRALTSGDVLVEPSIEGPLIGVEAFSEDGEHVICGLTEAVMNPPHMVINVMSTPIRQSAEFARAICDHVLAGLRALGVTEGSTHLELRMTPDGPRFIDAHLRIGGDKIPLLLKQVYGIDLERVLARRLIGEKVLPRLRKRLAAAVPDGATAICFATPTEAGRLTGLHGVAEAEAVPGVVSVTRLLADGAQVTVPLTHSTMRGAAVKADAPDAATAIAAARAGAAALRFEVQPR